MPAPRPEHIGRGHAAQAVWPRALAILAAAGLASSAHAGGDCDADQTPDPSQTYIWQSSQTLGSWSNPLNWLSPLGGSPGATDLAIFDGNTGLGNPPYGVGLEVFSPVRGLNVIDVNVSLQLAQQTLSVTGAIEACRELLIGGSLGSEVVMTGPGDLRTKLLRIGDKPDAVSALVLDGSPGPIDHQHIAATPLIVGDAGGGVLRLEKARLIQDGSLIVGRGIGSDGLLLVAAGSSMLLGPEIGGSIVVGSAGYGLIAVTSTGQVEHDRPLQLVLGDLPRSSGEYVFATPGVSHVMPVSSLEIGRSGDGLLRVEAGATVMMSATGPVGLGSQPSGDGEARVTDGGQWLVSGSPINIAPLGSGRLLVGEDSAVSTGGGIVRAFRDGTVAGSGSIGGSIRLRGGEIAPNRDFATSSARQVLRIDGNLLFSEARPATPWIEGGHMTFRLGSPDPAESTSAQVAGTAVLDEGTLRVIVLPDVDPQPGELYPVVEAGTLSGFFSSVQTPITRDGLVAIPEYPGDGTAYIRFVPVGAKPADLDPPETFAIAGTFTDAKVRDINADGFPDLVATSSNGPNDPGQIVIAFNLGLDGQGGWLGFDDTPETYESLGLEPISIEVGDMNQDEAPDLVVLHRSSSSDQVRIRLNDPGAIGDFSIIDPRSVTIPGTPADHTLADIGGDGLLDIITVYQPFFTRGSGGGINVAQDDGSGGFDDSDGDTGDDPGSVDTMGGELSPEHVATTSKTTEAVHVFSVDNATTSSAQPRGVFPLFFQQLVPVGRDPEDLFTRDLNGDGFDDIITADRRTGSISVSRAVFNGPNELFYEPAISLRAGDGSGGGQPESVVSLDVNDDTRPDIVYIARDEQGVRRPHAILNLGQDGQTGALIFARAAPLPWIGGAPRVLAIGDLDQDGREDLVAVRPGSLGVSAYLPVVAGPCGAADLAPPFGVLDLADVNAFVTAFVNQTPAADLVPPFGIFDLGDLNAFVTSFVDGCP